MKTYIIVQIYSIPYNFDYMAYSTEKKELHMCSSLMGKPQFLTLPIVMIACTILSKVLNLESNKI